MSNIPMIKVFEKLPYVLHRTAMGRHGLLEMEL